ncbi:hypothetical protein KL928_001363 [Ogataea angusta]|uniref:Uncharacterized protein n=1 Tax=Pichia angusta TaxID=870730 RepID=A0AAN6I7D8_PICAN|nr:uncharacterized protein KL928_001363 [Ogataea angusta]KAG7821279.1 hypothetical protein KL928_001363 [Ogataea angusta]
MSIKIEDLQIDAPFIGQYRTLNAVLCSYRRLERSQFILLEAMDFTTSMDLVKRGLYDDRLRLKSGQVATSTMILGAEMHQEKFERILGQLRQTADYPDPGLNPCDLPYERMVLVQLDGYLHSYRNEIEMKKTRLKLLTPNIIRQELPSDANLRDFLKRVQQHVPKSLRESMEERYKLSELLSAKRKLEPANSQKENPESKRAVQSLKPHTPDFVDTNEVLDLVTAPKAVQDFSKCPQVRLSQLDSTDADVVLVSAQIIGYVPPQLPLLAQNTKNELVIIDDFKVYISSEDGSEQYAVDFENTDAILRFYGFDELEARTQEHIKFHTIQAVNKTYTMALRRVHIANSICSYSAWTFAEPLKQIRRKKK